MILSLSLFLTLLPSSTKGNVPNVKKNCWALVSDTVHTGVKVCKIDLLNNLSFSLCAILPVCYMVETSDNRKKSKMRVSADLVCHCWILEIEFNKSLSSLIIRLANYSVTTSYIWVLTIGDAWSFSGIALLLWVEVLVLRHWQGWLYYGRQNTCIVASLPQGMLWERWPL